MLNKNYQRGQFGYMRYKVLKEKLLKGHKAAGKTFKVHLDGYNQLDLLKGEGPGVRKEIFYITDDSDLSAIRYEKWKIVFLQQKATGLDVWRPINT